MDDIIVNVGDTLNVTATVKAGDTAIADATVKYLYYTDSDCTKDTDEPNTENAGTYYVKAVYAAQGNYAGSETSEPATLTIVGTEDATVADPVVTYDETLTQKLTDEEKAAVEASVKSAAIAETDTDKLTEAIPEVDVASAEVKDAIGQLDTSNGEAVKVYTEVYLDIQATAYDNTDTTKTLTLDITPKYQVVVSTAGDDEEFSYDGASKNAVKVGVAKTVPVTKPVTISIILPTGFATETDTVYVTHVKNEGEENEVAYLYDSEITATDDGLVLSFTNPDGFSSFTFSMTAPEVLIEREDESTHVYRSLIAAIADVKENEIIQYTGADDSITTVSMPVSFTIDGEANIVAGDGYVLATTNNGDGTTTYTVTAKTASTGGTSSGVSTYAVSVANAEGGKVTASASKASKGTKVTLTVTAEDGKELDALTVTDASGKTLETTKNADGTYTFTMPASKVAVTATFKDAETQEPEPAEEDCPAEKFTDVDTSKWYHEAVDYVLTKGVMEGNSDGTFTPNGTLTRAQLAQILYNAAGKPEATAENPFTDVPENQWYAKAVIWAAQAGVVEGYGDGKFGPNDKISRQDLAVMLWRYAGEPTATKTSLDFTDAAQASDYATAALLWASETGIVQGDNGKLSPKGSATRAEAATMVMRYLELG
jgi:hypothetical protein